MKSGIRIGQIYEFEIQVREDMQAQFEDIVVHPLYSTATMLTHMEWASRQHILPVLESDEEGVGYHMTLDHRAPTPIGATVRIVSMVTGLKPGKVICHCTAFEGKRLVGQGTVVQAILPLSELRAKIPTPL